MKGRRGLSNSTIHEWQQYRSDDPGVIGALHRWTTTFNLRLRYNATSEMPWPNYNCTYATQSTITTDASVAALDNETLMNHRYSYDPFVEYLEEGVRGVT